VGAALPSSRDVMVNAGMRRRRMPAKLSGTAGLEAGDRTGGRRVRLNVRVKGHLNGVEILLLV
jgi:hypothetical protein